MKNLNRTIDPLVSSHVTEKSTSLLQENKYVFKVHLKTNKSEIKKEIENLYKVNVLAIKIINIPKKKVRVGKKEGWKKGYKKAIIEIKKGQTIETLAK